MIRKFNIDDTELFGTTLGYAVMTAFFTLFLCYEWFGKSNVEFNDNFKLPILLAMLFGAISGVIGYKYKFADENNFWKKYISVYAMTMLFGWAGMLLGMLNVPGVTIGAIVGFLCGLWYIRKPISE